LRRGLLLLLAASLAGCDTGGPPAPVPLPHYVVGEPYQAGGVWRYPREQFAYRDTGLAILLVREPGAALTADGEAFDPDALAAAHRTLQLPALARVTNLETGRAVLVRLNDRGPAAPGRLIAVTRRAADLLGAAGSAPFRVRVEVLETESRQLAAALAVAAPLEVAAAPVDTVQAETLAPPAGAAPSGRGLVAAAGPVVPAAPATTAPAAAPARLPEQVWQTAPSPGALFVECGSFARPQYAAIMQRRLAALGARVSTDPAAPRDAAWRVRIGPLRDAAEADATLDRALAAGVSDARIIVDDL
jgi:rare lipoprotein A